MTETEPDYCVSCGDDGSEVGRDPRQLPTDPWSRQLLRDVQRQLDVLDEAH